jgi:putative ABC transport system ATP-binding protein
MIEARDLRYEYPDGGFQLQLPCWQVPPGSRALVVGPSGSGKTTLLGLLAGILPVTSGELRVGSEQMERITDARRRTMRISMVGQVFQDLELVQYLTVRENILLPYFINHQFRLTAEAERRAERLAEQAQVASQLDRPVDRLSRGEQQRVAACRAMVVEPALILADEPTASLDGATGGQLLEMLFASCRQTGATLVMVSHQESLAAEFDQVLDLAAPCVGEE